MKLVDIVEDSVDIDWRMTDQYEDEGEEKVRGSLGNFWVDIWKGNSDKELYVDIVGYYDEKDEVLSGRFTEEDLFISDIDSIRNSFKKDVLLHIGSMDAGGCGKIGDKSDGCGFDWHEFHGLE